MSRLHIVLACALCATGCLVDDPVPRPAPPSGPAPQPQPRPAPVDAGDTDPPFPDLDGGAPIDAADLSCGDFGGPCCTDGPACVADFTHCDADLGLCAACGDIAGDCCPDGPACQPGLTCSAGVCGP